MRCISAAYVGMRCLSVCLSVRPSVTFVNCAKTNKDIFEIFFRLASLFAIASMKLQAAPNLEAVQFRELIPF